MTTRGQDAAIRLCVILREILKVELRYRLLTSNKIIRRWTKERLFSHNADIEEVVTIVTT